MCQIYQLEMSYGNHQTVLDSNRKTISKNTLFWFLLKNIIFTSYGGGGEAPIAVLKLCLTWAKLELDIEFGMVVEEVAGPPDDDVCIGVDDDGNSAPLPEAELEKPDTDGRCCVCCWCCGKIITSSADLIASTSSISEAEAVVVAVEAVPEAHGLTSVRELLAALLLLAELPLFVPWGFIADLTILAVSSLLSWTNVE